MTHKMCHVTHEGRCTFYENVKALAHTVSKIFLKNDDWLNYLIKYLMKLL